MAINCVVVDCKDPSKCCNNDAGYSEKHFEIPQTIAGLGDDSIYWIGSADRKQQYSIYYSPSQANIINIRKEEQINHMFILRELQMKTECMMDEFLIFRM